MQFQAALVYAMQKCNVNEQELSERTGANPRWITEITTNTNWRPRLDTILRLCYSLDFNIYSFLNFAEFGSGIDNPLHWYYLPKSLQWPHSSISLLSQKRMILDILPSHIAKTLRSFRKEKGLSQKKLASITPFSISTISLREGTRNKNYPTVTTLSSYCEAYDITFSHFMTRVFEQTISIDDSNNLFSQIDSLVKDV